MDENRCCYWLRGLFIGGLIGIVVGLLYAPRSGKEARREIGEKASDLAMRAKEEYEAALEKSKSRYESLLRQLKKAEAEAEENAMTGTEGS
jgi:gas vesicle protein